MPSDSPPGFWLRLIAKLVDGIVFTILTTLVSGITAAALIVPSILSHTATIGLSNITSLLLWPLVVCFAVGAWRHVWLLSSYRQATDGKQLLRLHVTGENGAAVTRKQALIRFLASYLPAMAVFLLVEYSGMHMVTQFAAMPDSTQTQALLKSYNEKIQAHQEPTTEERAAIEKAMEQFQDIGPSTGNALLINGLELAAVAYYMIMAGMVAFSKDKRGPHDLIARTYVVHGRLKPAIEAPQGVLLLGAPGGVWPRLGAKLLNGIAFFLAYIVIDRFIMMRIIPYSIHREGISMSAAVLAYALYYTEWLISSKQATPEKRALNLYVVRADDGLKIHSHQALLRFAASDFLVLLLPWLIEADSMLGPHFALLGIVSVFEFFYFLTMLSMMSRRKDKRGPHDFLARTYVLRGRPAIVAEAPLSGGTLSDPLSPQSKPMDAKKILGIAFLVLAVFMYFASSGGHKAHVHPKAEAGNMKKWQAQAAAGDVKAQTMLGNAYYQGYGGTRDYNQALIWYKKAAAQGDLVAARSIGNMYYSGDGVTKDMTEAVKWLRQAADQGDVLARMQLAHLYYAGDGVPKDFATALAWYQQAGELGYPEAQSQLGNMYFEGNGTAKDDMQAVKWWRAAAEQDNKEAACNLSHAYENGVGGLDKDFVQLYKWFSIATAKGATCYNDINAVIQPMTPEQRDEALRLAHEWSPHYEMPPTRQ